MRRALILTAAALTLSGCLETAGPAAGGGGGNGAQARKLSSGMSRAQADAVFGLDAGFERNPANWDESCVSYAYGSPEAPRYVHATFGNGKLIRATDGHGAICTYGAAL